MGDAKIRFRDWLSAQKLAPLPQFLGEEEWKAWGAGLRITGESLAWKVAVWALYGEEKFGYTPRQSGAILGLSPAYTRVCRWVGRTALEMVRQYPQFAKVTFSKFEQVAADAIHWSDKVRLIQASIDERMSLRDFLLYVRKWRTENGKLESAFRSGGHSQRAEADRVCVYFRMSKEAMDALKAVAAHYGYRSVDAYLAEHARQALLEIEARAQRQEAA